MTSMRALAASATVLISLAAAIVAGAVLGANGDDIIHFGVGAGFILLALAAFDFGMPRWAAWVGALAAGALGSIFVLQGVSNVVGNATLHQIAFDTLGHEIEHILLDLMYVWFVALLIFASHGRTRIMGAIVMTVVLGFEIATVVTPLLGVTFPTIKILFFLPFVWLPFEAAKHKSMGTDRVETRSPLATTSP